MKLQKYFSCDITSDIVCQGVECSELSTSHDFSRNCGLAVSEKVNKSTLLLPAESERNSDAATAAALVAKKPRWAVASVLCALSHLAPSSLLAITADFVGLIGLMGLHLTFSSVFPLAEAHTAAGVRSALPPLAFKTHLSTTCACGILSHTGLR